MNKKRKEVGSNRCRACNQLLKENEYVLCKECDEKSISDDEIKEFLNKVSEYKD